MPSYRYISRQERAGAVVLTIELARINDYGTAENMGKELINAVASNPQPKVIVDMSKVVYMSSVGYGPLITLRSRVVEAGGRLILCNLSKVIHELFESTRLLINPHSPGSLFEVAPTVEEALSKQ